MVAVSKSSAPAATTHVTVDVVVIVDDDGLLTPKSWPAGAFHGRARPTPLDAVSEPARGATHGA
jgi:hypothetical protein